MKKINKTRTRRAREEKNVDRIVLVRREEKKTGTTKVKEGKKRNKNDD